MTIADRLIAHRGWRNRFPENTLLAVKEAINAGALHVEIDIQLTADLVPVLFHDQTLERLCSDPADITTLTFTDLGAFNAYEPERLGKAFLGTPISSLAACIEAVATHPNVNLYVELKEESLQRFGVDTVLHAVLPVLQTLRAQCFLISFDLPVLYAAQRAGWERVVPVLTSLEQIATLSDLQPPLIFCDIELLHNTTRLTTLPYPVAVYEVGDYASAQHWLERGAALVESFCIGELISEDHT